MADEPQRVRRDAEDAARRLAAAVSGAIEGFLTGLDEQDLAGEVRESAKVAGEVVREAGTEAKAQADTPEMRMIADKAKVAGTATSNVAHSAADAVKGGVESVKTTAHDATASVANAAHRVGHAYEQAKEGVKVRAEAVAESGRRAREAPRRIGHELRVAVRTWWAGLVTAIALGALLAVFGVVTLVVLTIALVVGLNELVGDPAGTWIVVALYAVTMIALWAMARGARTRARTEVRERIDNSKEEARHVVAPVRRAFGGRGSI